MSAEGLIKSTLSLIEEIEATVECLVSQREALASGRLSDIQGLLQNVRHVAVKAQEAERDRHLKAVALAKQLRCDPSAQAIAFFLRNRMPEEWSDKKELILDTSQNEEARKKLFLQMINGELETEDDIIDSEDEQPRTDDEYIQ